MQKVETICPPSLLLSQPRARRRAHENSQPRPFLSRPKFHTQPPALNNVAYTSSGAAHNSRPRLNDRSSRVYQIYLTPTINDSRQWLEEQILSTATDITTTMAPSAISPHAPEVSTGRPEAGPAKIYPVKEAHFDGYQAPQPDGYKKARQIGSDNVAIVIDNGKTTAEAYNPHTMSPY